MAKGQKTLKVRGVPKPCWTGNGRSMLWVPADKRQPSKFMVLDWTVDGLSAEICEPFSNIICWCKGGALPAAAGYIGVKRLGDGTLIVDEATTDFEGLLEYDKLVPDYAGASYKPTEVLVEAGLVAACLAAPKDKRVPNFLYRSDSGIKKMGHAVVEAYGTDLKVVDYETGNWIKAVMIEKPRSGRTVIVGVAHPDKGIESSFCLQLSEYALRFPESPLLIARAKVGEELGLAVAQAYVDVIGDVYERDSYLGYAYPGVLPPYRPSPLGGARSAAALLAAAGAFLPPTNQFARPCEFDDLKIATSCGPGEWPTAILTLQAYVWLVAIALLNGIPVPEPKAKRVKKAVAAAREALADDARRAEIEALLAKQLPPGGLSAAGCASVEAALEKGVRGNEIVVATEGAHALCVKDSELRAVLKYLEMRQDERAAAVHNAIAPKMRIVVGDSRWAAAESNSQAMARAERAASAEVASKDVSWVSVQAAEAATTRAAQEEEAASFESVLGRAVDAVVERASSGYVQFRDVRAAVAVSLRADAAHFSDEINLLEDTSSKSPRLAVRTLKDTLRARGYTYQECGGGGGGKVWGARLCERLPAVAGAAPSSPQTAPVSPHASPRGEGVSFPPVDVRADRSRSRDEEPKQPQRSRRAPKPA